jgi:hypothetical protein
VSLEEHVLALQALLLVSHHPLLKGLDLLADEKLVFLGVFLGSFLLEKLLVLGW